MQQVKQGFGAAARHVLLSLQWDEGLTPLPRAIIEHSPPQWVFWVRLHPNMLAQQAKIAGWARRDGAGRCIVEEATDLPLPCSCAASTPT